VKTEKGRNDIQRHWEYYEHCFQRETLTMDGKRIKWGFSRINMKNLSLYCAYPENTELGNQQIISSSEVKMEGQH
jgi:hypothetical protein